MNHPGELKVGYCPVAFVRTGRSAVKMSKINWKVCVLNNCFMLIFFGIYCI